MECKNPTTWEQTSRFSLGFFRPSIRLECYCLLWPGPQLVSFSPYNRRLKCRDRLSVLSRFSIWRQLSTKVNWLDPIKQHWDWHGFQVARTKRGWRHRLRRSDLTNSLTLCLKACLTDWKASWSFFGEGQRTWCGKLSMNNTANKP